MQLPQMTIRKWMVVVAFVALMSCGIQWDGFHALAWETPILGASLAIWMATRTQQQFAARMLGAAVLLWLIVGLGLPPVNVALGVGHTNVRVSFVVLDADTGQPVDGASIHLRDPDFADFPGDPLYDIDLETRKNGSTSVSLDLQCNSSWDQASGRLLSFRVRYPQWDIRVGCEGYQEFTTPFASYEKGNPRFHDGASPPPHNPPPIVIRVRKLGPAHGARVTQPVSYDRRNIVSAPCI